MPLKVRGRMMVILVAVLAGMALLVGIHHWSGVRIEEEIARTDEIRRTIDHLGKLRVSIVELELAAKDLVITYADGLDANRVADMAFFVKDFRSDYAAVKEFAATAGAGFGGRDVGVEFDKLVRLIDSELKPAVVAKNLPKILELKDSVSDQSLFIKETITSFNDLGIAGMKRAFAEVTTAVTLASQASMLALAIAVVMLAPIIFMIARSILRPLAQLTTCMQRIAEGDTEIEVPAVKRRDELGEIARTVEVFKRNASDMRRLEASQEQDRLRVEAEKAATMASLADRFNASVGSVVERASHAVETMRGLAADMASAADETHRLGAATGTASEQATANVQTVASAAEELATALKEVSGQVTRSASVAQQAVQDAQATNETVESMAEAARKIGEVVGLINNIAGQTNLLALNATIEAARAGDAGKGFAIVASEVKNLATQTARATDEISAQITAMQSSVNQSVAAIRRINSVIAEIDEIATTIAAAVEEQEAATREIARNVSEASVGTQEVSRNIGAVTETAERSGKAAEAVRSASESLSTDVKQLRGEVDGFLAQVRAA